MPHDSFDLRCEDPLIVFQVLKSAACLYRQKAYEHREDPQLGLEWAEMADLFEAFADRCTPHPPERHFFKLAGEYVAFLTPRQHNRYVAMLNDNPVWMEWEETERQRVAVLATLHSGVGTARYDEYLNLARQCAKMERELYEISANWMREECRD